MAAGGKAFTLDDVIKAASKQGGVPVGDGTIRRYEFPLAPEPKPAGWKTQPIMFINGMGNSGMDHVTSAMAASWVHNCPVIGLYNKTNGFGLDLLQCLGDKINMTAMDPGKLIASLVKRADRASIVRAALSRNRAQVAVFDFLSANPGMEIHAHSQGNLILANALVGVALVKGEVALKSFRIFSYGSPTCYWPAGLNRKENAFTFDYVSWLGGIDLSFSVSKVGMPSGSLNPITHGFLEYIKRDAAFFVNAYRWGSLGVTASMDEAGLAKGLYDLGANLTRVDSIFKHLENKHNSDSDDVARLYVTHLKGNSGLLEAVKGSPVKATLKRILSTGWKSGDDEAALRVLGP